MAMDVSAQLHHMNAQGIAKLAIVLRHCSLIWPFARLETVGRMLVSERSLRPRPAFMSFLRYQHGKMRSTFCRLASRRSLRGNSSMFWRQSQAREDLHQRKQTTWDVAIAANCRRHGLLQSKWFSGRCQHGQILAFWTYDCTDLQKSWKCRTAHVCKTVCSLETNENVFKYGHAMEFRNVNQITDVKPLTQLWLKMQKMRSTNSRLINLYFQNLEPYAIFGFALSFSHSDWRWPERPGLRSQPPKWWMFASLWNWSR